MYHCISDLNENHFIKFDCRRVWSTKIVSSFREYSLHWCLAHNTDWSCYKVMLFNKYFRYQSSKTFSFPPQSVHFLSFGQSSPLQLFQLSCKEKKHLNSQSMPPAIMEDVNWSRAKGGDRVEYRWHLFNCLAC